MEKLGQFWEMVVNVWERGVFGIDVGRIVVAIAILAVFILARRLFTRFIIARVESAAKRTKTDLDNRIVEALEGPVRFIPVVLGVFFAAEYMKLEGSYSLIADNLVRSFIAYTIFWAFYRMVDPFSFLLSRLEKIFTAEMIDWLVKAIKATFAFIGAVTILGIWGIQVAPIIAGLGLFGVAVALGAQDLFKNLIAGILIISEKRFRKGDWIRVENVVEGTVETIGFRSTVVRRFDKAPVYVPNSRLSDSAVTNFTAMTHRRIYWKIGVEYRTTIDQLRRIRDGIEAFITGDDAFAPADEVATFVHIDSFSDSSIDIMLYCFTKTTVWGEWLADKERLALKVKEIVEGAGSGFAFPSRSVYVESLPGSGVEIFVPPGTGAEKESKL
jgi:MscS family membrane protein